MRKELTPVTTKKNVKQKQKWQKQKRTEELQNKHKTVNRMTIVSPSLSKINLNVNRLISPLKTQNKVT